LAGRLKSASFNAQGSRKAIFGYDTANSLRFFMPFQEEARALIALIAIVFIVSGFFQAAFFCLSPLI
jgi:hypothetical protein